MATLPIAFDEPLTEEQSMLAASCERMVVSIANKAMGDGGDRDDLIDAGYMGLIRAAQTYDPSRNTKFSTHAYRNILAKVMQCRQHAHVRRGRYVNGINLDLFVSRDEGDAKDGPVVDAREVRKAFESLPPQFQDVVKHRVWGTDTLVNTAKTLKCCKQTVISRKTKAFGMLRLSLWRYAGEASSTAVAPDALQRC